MGALVEIGDKPLLLFDGVCNLCNGAVNFIIDRDLKQQFVFASLQSTLGQQIAEQYQLPKEDKQQFVFASLQSTLGQQIAEQYQLPKEDFNSMVLLKNNKLYLRSNAALEISRDLSGGWPLLYAFKIVPRFIRDWVYTIISSNRYKWFGRQDQCRIPTADIRNRFVSS